MLSPFPGHKDRAGQGNKTRRGTGRLWRSVGGNSQAIQVKSDSFINSFLNGSCSKVGGNQTLVPASLNHEL